MFVIYSDSDGKNVTLSPRLGQGHILPSFNQDAEVSLLAGSGISNNVMTANIRCSSCKTWSGGSMDFTDTASSWLWAIKDGSPLDSDSQSAQFTQHDTSGTFNVNLKKAAGGSSSNPFQTTSGSTSTTPSSSSPISSTSGSNSAGSGDDDSGATAGYSSSSPSSTMIIAHGVLMSLAFLILFPFGAMSLRLLSFPGLVWLHAGTQLLAYTVAIAGMGLGIYIALYANLLNESHPIIGLVVVSLLVFQPFLGIIHHLKFRKLDRRTFWSHAHMWFGRCLIILGAVNGGLGLQLAGNTTSGEIAYGVVAGVIFLIYIVVVVPSEIRRARPPQAPK